MFSKTSLFLYVLVVLGLFVSASETPVSFTARHLWEMERVGTPQVSPGGDRVVFAVNRFDLDANQSQSDLYLLDLETGLQRRLTFTGKESAPVWSPAGDRIAFLSRRGDGPAQVYVMPADGGEAEKVTDLPVAVHSLRWFPCGNRLAFGANVPPAYEGDFGKLKTLLEEQKASKVTAKVTENAMYRFWDRWLTDGHYPRLFRLDLQDRKVTDLMPHTSNFGSMMGGIAYDIAPDGEEIAVSFNSTEAPFSRLNYDVFLLPTDGSGAWVNLTAGNPAGDLNPTYSPCGRYLVWGSLEQPDFGGDHVRLMRYQRSNGTLFPLTAEVDLSCQDWFFSPDGVTLYFHAEDRAKGCLFALPVEGGSPGKILSEGSSDGARLAGREGDRLVFAHQSISRPVELFQSDLLGGNQVQLTRFNEERLATIALGAVENVTFRGAEGADVQMFVVYPPDFDPAKKYPLVQVIHGGPHTAAGDRWHYRWNNHLFAAPGYVVAVVNFHGSTSFGWDFAHSIQGENANKPFADIMAATDYLIAQGFIDESRMAATGGSYGGYLVSWIAGHTDRFAALINHAGVYDISVQFASDMTAHRVSQYGGAPWADRDLMDLQNPARFAHAFQTPMLVIHGEKDYRVPVVQGFLIYGIYKRMGLEARLVYYPDENHWILTPQNGIHWNQEVHDWLARFLSRDEVD